MNFCRRFMKYSLSVQEQYSVLPIVLAICIHNICNELLELGSTSNQVSCMKELPSYGWAKACFLLNKESIRNFINETPLDPPVALMHFFVEQQPSLLNITRNNGATVQILYDIAKRVFQGKIAADKDKDDALQEVCAKPLDQFNITKKLLAEDFVKFGQSVDFVVYLLLAASPK